MNDSTTRSAAGPPPESDAIAPAPPPPPAEGEVRAEARSRWRRVPWFAFGTIVLGSAFASVLALFAASA